MSVGTIEDAGEISEGSPEAADAAGPAEAADAAGAAKSERRVLAATLVTAISVIGAMLFALHATMQDYVVQLGSWYN